MGPNNTALLNLYKADTVLRAAQEKLESATRNVRLQRRRVQNLEKERDAAVESQHRAQSSRAQLELDLKARDQRIEQLRSQQQSSQNNREYQGLLVEINTQKVDRGKIEEQALAAIDAAEKAQASRGSLDNQVREETTRLTTMETDINQHVKDLQAEIDTLAPKRDAASKALPDRLAKLFEQVSEKLEGETMAPISRIDAREERFVCNACNMELYADVYNRLHSRDEPVVCPSCNRLLYIPDELTPEIALRKKKSVAATTAKRSRARSSGSAANPTKALKKIVGVVEAESIRLANEQGQEPVDLVVALDGKIVGEYRGRDVEHVDHGIRARMQAEGLAGALTVRPRDPSEDNVEASADA